MHIKLPKGKVSQACVRASQYHSQLNEAERMAYLRDLEAWRKEIGTSRRLPKSPKPPKPPTHVEEITAKWLLDMADACTFSTGDVYVSTELWNQIKGYY